MHRGLITISVLATSCWTSAAAPPPATTPSDPTATRSARALASELADDLRDPDDSMFVERFIDRQVVVLELESRTIQVLCDAQTLTAAVRISELLNDRDRPPAVCTISATGSGFICTQGTGSDYLRLDFTRIDDGWRLLGGVLPRGPVPSADAGGALVAAYRAKLGVPACPP